MAGFFADKPPGGIVPTADKLTFGTSCYGKPLPIVYGTTRVAGNIIWMPYALWKYKKGEDGGKGGEARREDQYWQGVAIAICEGPIAGIDYTFIDKTAVNIKKTALSVINGDRQQDIWLGFGEQPLPPRNYTSLLSVPEYAPFDNVIGVFWLSSAGYEWGTSQFLEWRSELGKLPGVGTTWDWIPDIAPGDEWNGQYRDPVDVVPREYCNDVDYPRSYPYYYTWVQNMDGTLAVTFSPSLAGAPVMLYWYGEDTTTAWRQHYPGTTFVASRALPLGSSNQMKNFSFEVRGFFATSTTKDVHPADIIVDLLTNPYYGCGWDRSWVEVDLGQDGTVDSGYRTYCDAMGFRLSMALTEQKNVLEHIQTILDATNSTCVWSEMKLKIVPLGDQQVGTYKPVTTPVYDLVEADFLPLSDGSSGEIESPSDGPIVIKRLPVSETFNAHPIEYTQRDSNDPANRYNKLTVTYVEQSDVIRSGYTREASLLSLPCIPNAAHALVISQINAKRSCYERNTYSFALNHKFAILEAFDIVSLTHAKLGLNKKLVRITAIDEDPVTQTKKIEAKEVLIGVSHAAAYQTQQGESDTPDTNPAMSNPPFFFVPPLGLTADGVTPELWIGTSGMVEGWAGAQVHVSWDGGRSYTYVADVKRSTYGMVTNQLASGQLLDDANTIIVNLQACEGTLTSVSEADMNALSSACLVEDEIIAFRDATLIGVSQYRLSHLLRGCNGTVNSPHNVNAKFIKLDDTFLRLPIGGRLGSTIFVKLCSFDSTKSTIQDISSTYSYQYVIGGSDKKTQEFFDKLPIRFNFDTFIREDWEIIGNGDVSIASDGLDGGNSLVVRGALTMIRKELLAIGGDTLYGVFSTFKQAADPTLGGKTFTIGLCGYLGDGVTKCNRVGADSFSDQYTLSDTVATGTWKTFTGYVKSRDVGSGLGTIATPGTFHPNVRYVRLMVTFNDVSGNGTQQIDTLKLYDASAEKALLDASAVNVIAANAQATAANAEAIANNAQAQAQQALAQLGEAATDNILTVAEKQMVALNVIQILGEEYQIIAQAQAFGITTELTAYESAFGLLFAYLRDSLQFPVDDWRDQSTISNWITSGPTTIVGETFRSQFSYYYEVRQGLLNKIANVAKVAADAAGTAASNALAIANTARSTADTAAVEANIALSKLANIASDNVLSPGEKPALAREMSSIQSSYEGTLAQADLYGTDTSAMINAYNALADYMYQLGVNNADWLTTETPINGSLFRGMFTTYYTAMNDVLVAIATATQDYAINLQNAINRHHTFYDTTMAREATEQNGGVYAGQPLAVGDLWFDTNNNYHPWRWNGSTWDDTHDVTPIVASQITTGLITADKISAGSITVDKLQFGTGNNLLPNCDFAESSQSNDSPPVTSYLTNWSIAGITGTPITGSGINYSGYTLGATTDPQNSEHLNTAWVSQGVPIGAGEFNRGIELASTSIIPVVAGQIVCASGFTAAHRCAVDVLVEFYNSGGSLIANTHSTPAAQRRNDAEASGGAQLVNYKRIYDVSVVPPTGVRARIRFIKYDTKGGETSSYMFVTRAMLEVLPSTSSNIASTFSPGEWSPYATTVIDGSGIKAGTIKTSNYEEDGSGYPTKGVKLDHRGTALKVAPANFQMGSVVLKDLWFAQTQVGLINLSYYSGAWSVSTSGITIAAYYNATAGSVEDPNGGPNVPAWALRLAIPVSQDYDVIVSENHAFWTGVFVHTGLDVQLIGRQASDQWYIDYIALSGTTRQNWTTYSLFFNISVLAVLATSQKGWVAT